jgi:F0F1-type ATP synthase membrane subunit b/b'
MRDFLDRFRPAGAPGSAARAGVPADRTRELAAELEPVLTLLADLHAECERIVADAKQEASRIAADARSAGAAIAADADRQARAARAEAAGQVLAGARAQAREAAAEAERQARQLRGHAAGRMPALVARAVSLVRAGLDSGTAQAEPSS